MEGFFDACINKIVKLIQIHIKRIEERHSRPKVSAQVRQFLE